MSDASDHILDLITGYLMGELNAGQMQELEQWRLSSTYNRMLFEQLTDPAGIKNDLLQMGSINGQPVWDQIRQEIPGLPEQFKDDSLEETSTRRLKTVSWYWWAAAALVAIISVLALWFFAPDSGQPPPREKRKDSPHLTQQSVPIDSVNIKLILSNDSVIALTPMQDDIPRVESGTLITRNNKGIAYNTTEVKNSPQDPVYYNTIVTPPGKTCHIIWADGSDAWLSAGSALRYPVQFMLNERKVELIGEAFFTVKPVKDQPFLVVAKGTINIVHGTSFNISAYPSEEGVRTTVEQGKVLVINKKDSVFVLTGEEARLTAANGWKVSKLTNAANAGSWRLGVLEFDQAPLEEVLLQVAEWYTYKIQWQPGAFSKERMTGRLNITDPITDVVKAIEKNFMVRIEVDTPDKILRIYQ